jgi:oligopeptide transport system substrate-binding protein
MSRRAALLVLGLASAACSSQDREFYGTTTRTGKAATTFYANNSSEPEYLDPGMSHDTASSNLIYQMFEGLTTYDPKDTHPVQGVASRWDQSDDNRVFRFHLRDDSRWSDGKPVTAHDFEYAWKRVLRPATASIAAANLYVIKNGELFNQSKLKVTRRDVDLASAPDAGAPSLARLPKGTAVVVLGPAPSAPKTHARVARHAALPTFSAKAPPPAGDASSRPTGFVALEDLAADDAVLGVRAVDERTLEVELEQPTPWFIDLLSHTCAMPVRRDVIEAWAARGKEDLWVRPENIVTNGPYILDKWRFRYEITLKQNPHYRDRDKLRFDRVVFMAIEEAHATMNLYKAGDMDFIGSNASLPAEYMPLLETMKDFQRFLYLSVYWYEFNTSRPPVDDVRVRRALNLAIDKQQLVEKVTRAGQLPATHYVPDFVGSGYAEQGEADRRSGSDPFAAPDDLFDPVRARALLAEAGYDVVAHGDDRRASKFPPLEILYNTGEGHRQIAVAVQDMWKRHLGISVTLRNEEWKVMLKNLRDGNFHVARSGWIGDYNHPNTWLETFASYSPQNRTKWLDPEYDLLLKKAAAVSDRTESIRLYRRAERRALDGMSKLPIYFNTKSTLVKPWVKGYRGNPRNTHLVKWFWIDPDWRTNASNEPALTSPEFPEPGRLTE